MQQAFEQNRISQRQHDTVKKVNIANDSATPGNEAAAGQVDDGEFDDLTMLIEEVNRQETHR